MRTAPTLSEKNLRVQVRWPFSLVPPAFPCVVDRFWSRRIDATSICAAWSCDAWSRSWRVRRPMAASRSLSDAERGLRRGERGPRRILRRAAHRCDLDLRGVELRRLVAQLAREAADDRVVVVVRVRPVRHSGGQLTSQPRRSPTLLVGSRALGVRHAPLAVCGTRRGRGGRGCLLELRRKRRTAGHGGHRGARELAQKSNGVADDLRGYVTKPGQNCENSGDVWCVWSCAAHLGRSGPATAATPASANARSTTSVQIDSSAFQAPQSGRTAFGLCA